MWRILFGILFLLIGLTIVSFGVINLLPIPFIWDNIPIEFYLTLFIGIGLIVLGILILREMTFQQVMDVFTGYHGP